METAEEIKAKMESLTKELQLLGKELNKAIDQAAENIEVKDGLIVHGLREVFERVTARSEEILGQLDSLQDELNKQGGKGG